MNKHSRVTKRKGIGGDIDHRRTKWSKRFYGLGKPGLVDTARSDRLRGFLEHNPRQRRGTIQVAVTDPDLAEHLLMLLRGLVELLSARANTLSAPAPENAITRAALLVNISEAGLVLDLDIAYS